MRRLTALVFALATAIAGAPLLGATPAAANPTPVIDGFEAPSTGLSAYGDFTTVGNGSLRCPKDGDPTFLLNTAQACRGATQRQHSLLASGSNNGYYMQLAGDGGADPSVFDRSAATLSIPAGTSVQYAQLDWGGNTGKFTGSDEPRCISPLHLLKSPATLPPAPAASAAEQPVQLDLGTGDASQVKLTPEHYASSQSAMARAEMYTDWADVTDDLAGLAGGVQTTVSVANVWAAAGYGCAAGWSLTVVFGAPQPVDGYQTLRQFDVYTTHVRAANGTDLSAALPELNVKPDTAHVEMGVTAYEGDWDNPTDQLLVSGTAVDDPCGGDLTHDNFFSSCATGALDPLDSTTPIPDNLSVDAKMFQPTETANTSDGMIGIEVRTLTDSFVLQSIVVAEDIHPSISEQITMPKRTLREGSTLKFTVSGTNDGDIPLTVATLDDLVAADCQHKVLGDIPVGGAYSADCTTVVPKAPSLSDTATVTATWPHDDSGLQVSNHADFSGPIAGPQLSVVQQVDPAVARVNVPVTVTFTVTNNGTTDDGPVSGVQVTDAALTGCTTAPIDSLDPGASAVTNCVVKPAKTTVSTATASAKDETGAALTADSAPATVTVIHPSLSITTTADPAQVKPGADTQFTVIVHNTGDVALTITITNDTAKDCDFSITGGGLLHDAARSQQCVVRAPNAGTIADTASYSANPAVAGDTGPALTGQAKGQATVNPDATGTGGSGGNGNGDNNGGGSSGTASNGSSNGSGSSGSGDTKSGPGGKKLAYTGVSLALPLGIAVVLLAGGGVLLLLTRRRRRGREDEAPPAG